MLNPDFLSPRAQEFVILLHDRVEKMVKDEDQATDVMDALRFLYVCTRTANSKTKTVEDVPAIYAALKEQEDPPRFA